MEEMDLSSFEAVIVALSISIAGDDNRPGGPIPMMKVLDPARLDQLLTERMNLLIRWSIAELSGKETDYSQMSYNSRTYPIIDGRRVAAPVPNKILKAVHQTSGPDFRIDLR